MTLTHHATTMYAYDLLVIANQYIPVNLSLVRAVRGFHMLAVLGPLLAYARNQQQYRRHESAWMTELKALVRSTFGEPVVAPDMDDPPYPAVGKRIANEVEDIYEHLYDVVPNEGLATWGSDLPVLMRLPFLDCPYCIPKRPLFKLDQVTRVPLLTRGLTQGTGLLVFAKCWKCGAHFFPDRITKVGPDGERHTQMLADAEFLRVSRTGLWVDRSIAHMQECAFAQFHGSISGFRSFFNCSFARGEFCKNTMCSTEKEDNATQGMSVSPCAKPIECLLNILCAGCSKHIRFSTLIGDRESRTLTHSYVLCLVT